MITLENNNHVCIAHYNDKLDWVNNLNLPFTIISRQHTEENVWPNVGRKASVYLKFIINNYDNLWGVTFFIGDTENKKFIDGNIWNVINNFKINKDTKPGYSSITNVMSHSINNEELISKFDKYKDFIEEALNKKIDYHNFMGKNHNHFYVTKPTILKNNIEVYNKLYNGLKIKCKEMKNDIENPSILLEQLFEYSWHYIFN